MIPRAAEAMDRAEATLKRMGEALDAHDYQAAEREARNLQAAGWKLAQLAEQMREAS